ncbi:single-stranded DNA-binding protein [Nodosilinea sp. E11]|uniref:single-stranded DNA-binding protein n=1 Tax=Nodosilinea sp. E11 TaxID=3037479 RepID=UPI002934268F|nr:single-stranded DNA-binding protein [Nodosilinea sp. E11]WOD37351.1 single-stranded DNA-binding protein [Nodosilinea sp. E11]
MTDNTADLARALKQIEVATMAIAASNPPNWKRPLSAYKNEWVAAIGAIEVASDAAGPTVIWWMGHHYTRRSGSNPKFGAAIWFSRSAGKGEDGEAAYLRLITFADGPPPAAEPLPDYVVKALDRSK